jgi:hypothetical protein
MIPPTRPVMSNAGAGIYSQIFSTLVRIRPEINHQNLNLGDKSRLADKFHNVCCSAKIN